MKLLILAAGILQIPVIKKARDMGYYVVAADGNPEAVGLPLADKAIVANITSEEEMLQIAREEKIDGVIHPCSEVSMNVMGRINDVLGLSGISRETAIRATNKHQMREAFERYGAPSPKSFCTDNAEEAWSIFNNKLEGQNAILKPSRNSGSRGVAKVRKAYPQPLPKGKGELEWAASDFEQPTTREVFLQLYERALTESRDHSVMIEQFVEGPEFSVEIIVWNGVVNVLTVTDKKTTEAPYFVELGHNQPSIYPNTVVDAIKEAAISGVKALGLNNCAAHAELKVMDEQPYLMEIGARLGGDFISTELTHLSTGIDMVAAAVNVALGIEPNLQPITKPQGVCIRYFTPKPGRLVAINHTEALEDFHIYDAEIYHRVGDLIPEVRSSLDRSGHVIVTDRTAEEAIERADNIINNVVFETE